jgi:hypothetical protein
MAMNAWMKTLITLMAAFLSAVCLAATDRSPSANPPALRVHPKVFSLIDCWISDSERPVVTEVNLDAVEKNGNEFNDDGVARDGEWMKAPGEGSGFMRYRVVAAKGNRYQVEYQENGGGSLTTACLIEFAIEKRQIRRDGKPVTFRALRVLAIESK